MNIRSFINIKLLLLLTCVLIVPQESLSQTLSSDVVELSFEDDGDSNSQEDGVVLRNPAKDTGTATGIDDEELKYIKNAYQYFQSKSTLIPIQGSSYRIKNARGAYCKSNTYAQFNFAKYASHQLKKINNYSDIKAFGPLPPKGIIKKEMEEIFKNCNETIKRAYYDDFLSLIRIGIYDSISVTRKTPQIVVLYLKHPILENPETYRNMDHKSDKLKRLIKTIDKLYDFYDQCKTEFDSHSKNTDTQTQFELLKKNEITVKKCNEDSHYKNYMNALDAFLEEQENQCEIFNEVNVRQPLVSNFENEESCYKAKYLLYNKIKQSCKMEDESYKKAQDCCHNPMSANCNIKNGNFYVSELDENAFMKPIQCENANENDLVNYIKKENLEVCKATVEHYKEECNTQINHLKTELSKCFFEPNIMNYTESKNKYQNKEHHDEGFFVQRYLEKGFNSTSCQTAHNTIIKNYGKLITDKGIPESFYVGGTHHLIYYKDFIKDDLNLFNENVFQNNKRGFVEAICKSDSSSDEDSSTQTPGTSNFQIPGNYNQQGADYSNNGNKDYRVYRNKQDTSRGPSSISNSKSSLSDLPDLNRDATSLTDPSQEEKEKDENLKNPDAVKNQDNKKNQLAGKNEQSSPLSQPRKRITLKSLGENLLSFMGGGLGGQSSAQQGSYFSRSELGPLGSTKYGNPKHKRGLSSQKYRSRQAGEKRRNLIGKPNQNIFKMISGSMSNFCTTKIKNCYSDSTI